MKLRSVSRVICLSIVLSSMALPAFVVPVYGQQSQEIGVALQRGFRTGYSDGYMAGYRDSIDGLARSYSRHSDYGKADRAFNKEYGTVEDYRDGYQQGFESGYDTGFTRKGFDSTIPNDLKRRGIVSAAPQPVDNRNVAQTTNDTANQIPEQPSSAADSSYTDSDTTDNRQQPTSATYQSTNGATYIIPRDTELILELQEDLNTEQSREGEKFTAKVASPSELSGATVEGRVAKVVRPGRIKKRSEMSLSFDRIILADGRWTNFNATMTEVLAVKGDNIQRVDEEGTAIGKSSYKNDAVKVGGATGVGLVTGAIIGGPVGAGVGAGLGAAFGVGAVVIERGKHIRLNRNQQLRIKTSYESQIR